MNAPLDTTLELETPEHIAFRYQLGGPGQRAVAYVIDLIIRGLVLTVLSILLMIGGGDPKELGTGAGIGILLFVYFLLEWGYYVAFEFLMAGASPGKKMMRLRVVHQDGRAVTISDSILRNLLRAADLLPVGYAIGILSMMLDTKFRRLGDMVAQTVVVHEPATQAGAISTKERAMKIEGLPARPQLSVDERDALALFCRRLPQLNPARALELAEITAPLFIERFKLNPVDPIGLLCTLHERTSGQTSASELQTGESR